MVEVKRIPEFKVAYIRHFGEYGMEGTLRTLTRLLRWGRSRGLLETSQVLGIPWNDPRVTPAQECCYDACLTVPIDFESDHPIIATQVLPASTYLVRTCRCTAGDLETPWQEFLAWYNESPWDMTGQACFEVYTENSFEDETLNWSLQLHIPVVTRKPAP